MTAPIRVPLADVKYREDLYPRIKADPAVIQRYAADLDVLPPIEVNQHNELIDGFHRWTAHRKAEAETIAVTVTETASDVELLALACERNAKHGLQLNDRDKASMAVRLFHAGAGLDEASIAQALSVSARMVRGYLSDVKADLRKQQREKVFSLWLQCWTQEQIAEAVGLEQQRVAEIAQEMPDLEALPNPAKLAAMYQDADWQPPLFDVWTAARKQGEHLTRRDEILKALGLRADQSNKGQTGKYADVTGDNLSPVKTTAEIVRCVAALDERKQQGERIDLAPQGAKLPGKSAEKTADLLGVSPRTIERARRRWTNASSEEVTGRVRLQNQKPPQR